LDPRRLGGRLLPSALLAAVVSLMATAATAAPVVTPYVNGLSVGTGMAYHPTNHHVYFLEATTGRMAKVSTANGAVTLIQTGLVHPDDIALWPGANIAYITTRVGELWRASTISNARSLVASGLGIPLALVLDPGNHDAYTVDYASGTLWRVDVQNGNKTAVVTGLNDPRGLRMSADFKTAFITEANRLISVDLQTQQVTELVGSLVNPWYMDWAADDHSAIYLVDRDPGNRLHRVDLSTTPATVHAIVPLPSGGWSVVRSANPDVLYVTSKTALSKISLSGGAGGPIITRLGFIPSTEIDPLTGQATTDPSYFFYVKNASFGGSIHVMLNFPGMFNSGAKYYKVYVDNALDVATWTNYKWIANTFVLQNVGPSSGYYTVPAPGDVWAIPDLGFLLDSTKYSNAVHTLKVVLYDAFLTPLNLQDTVNLLVDNVPPVMDIQMIEHDGQPLNQCALITSGSADITITFKAWDAQGHLYNWALTDHWGSGQAASIGQDQYIGVHDGSPTWSGVNPLAVTYTFSNTACAHQIALGGWANTTNGYSHIHYASDTEHIAIYLGGQACQ
jgi:sugar lactone lactonase YvrE